MSGPWVGVAGGFTTVRRGCQTCDEPTPARHTGSLLVDVGNVVNPRTLVAAEVVWIPVRTVAGRK